MEQNNQLTIPLKSLSKGEISDAVSDFLNTALEHHNAGDLYVYLKQAEAAIKSALEKMKDPALDSIGKLLGGENGGEILGHDVKIKFSSEWVYSAAIAELETRQKAELKSAQLAEQATGKARRLDPKISLTVTLRK